MKKLLALLLALVMVVALAACGVTTENAAAPAASSGSEPAADSGAAGSGVRLFNGKIEIATPLEHAAQVYEEATGKHVEVESLGGGVDLQATLKQYYQAGNMPDIFVGEGAEDFNNWSGMMVDMADQAWAADTDAGFVDEATG
ncbi:MAG: carbohydrate ABC transporter substrate-binding protein, partial [Oscillospiraceae bacterium]|nr:carbohydrate ABC transporter substrate-binding protein [Oscillospiraceae bacterium]